MKAVLASLKPYYYYLVGEGIKRVELRKTRPKAEDWSKDTFFYMSRDEKSFSKIPKEFQEKYRRHFGKVGLRFVCDKIENIEIRHFTVFGHENLYTAVGENPDNLWLKHSCISYGEVVEYGKLAPLYGWHISDLKLYDEPLEVGEFYVNGKASKTERETIDRYSGLISLKADIESYERVFKGKRHITKPPQSWCYVEEMICP